jgi:hypothetical protein
MKTTKFITFLRGEYSNSKSNNPVGNDWVLTILRNNPDNTLYRVDDEYEHKLKRFFNNPDHSMAKNWQGLKHAVEDENGLICIGYDKFP